LAYNEETKTTDYYPVTDVLVHTDPVVEHLVIDHEEIKTTPEHPFYTEESGWRTADKLQPGTHVRKADGTYGEVKSVSFVNLHPIKPRRRTEYPPPGLVFNGFCNPERTRAGGHTDKNGRSRPPESFLPTDLTGFMS
jgi:hypothetical protein